MTCGQTGVVANDRSRHHGSATQTLTATNPVPLAPTAAWRTTVSTLGGGLAHGPARTAIRNARSQPQLRRGSAQWVRPGGAPRRLRTLAIRLRPAGSPRRVVARL